MEIKQIYDLVNTITTEELGLETVVKEDLTNIVDVGKEIFNGDAVDRYVRSLVNHIGKVIFVDRPYSGTAPSVMMDGWEYGSILEKITVDELPEAEENESWELTDRVSYDVNVFYKPKVSAKFYNKRTTFEIPMSFTEMQVKQSFSNAGQLNAFLSMLRTSVDNSMTVKTDALISRVINNMILQTMHAEFPDGDFGDDSGIKAVNLLKLYNDKFEPTTPLTAEKCMTSPEFIRWASYTMGLYTDRMRKMSTLFNVGGKARFTPSDRLHFILLSEFAKAADIYLQSDTFHDNFTKLPNAETVPYWQGSGLDYGSETGEINGTIETEAGKVDVNVTGILGVMFDRWALGVANLDKRVTTNYNAKAEFWNNWYKFDAGYFNDLNENFVVFYVADAET